MPKYRKITVVRHKKAVGAKLNKREIREVKRIVGSESESKYQITQNVNVGISAAPVGPAMLNLISPGQGISGSQRTGDKIHIKQMQIRMSLIYGDATNYIRCIFFQWIPNTATQAPTAGAILDNPANGILTPMNQVNQGVLFRPLLDRTYSLVSSGSNAVLFRAFRLYGSRLGRKTLQFNPAATTGFNQIFCLAFSDSAAAPTPGLSIITNTTYVDA